MLAVSGPPPSDDTWATELKFDGMRGIAISRGGRWRIYSRAQRKVTPSFPDVAERLAAAIPDRDCILDGEIVSLAADGRPSFRQLQRRIHLNRPTTAAIQATQVEYVIFDLLALDGEPTTELPYFARRQLLEALDFTGAGLRIAPSWPGSDAERVLAEVAAFGLEGIL